MTIDERLNRLTERHEALTQSVELLVHSQREAAERTEAVLARVIGVIEDLARIVQSRERRITGLEGGRA